MGCSAGVQRIQCTTINIQQDYCYLGLSSKEFNQISEFYFKQTLHSGLLDLEEFFRSLKMRISPLLYGIFDPFSLLCGRRKLATFTEVCVYVLVNNILKKIHCIVPFTYLAISYNGT